MVPAWTWPPNGGRVNGITASPQPLRSCRTPGYRPFAPAGSVVPPFITTMTCSDFRSALRHFTDQLLIGLAFTGNHVVAQRNHPKGATPVPRRISPVPRCTVQPFRPPYPGGYIGAAHSKLFTPSMAFAAVKKARLPHCGRNEAARFLIVRTGCLLAAQSGFVMALRRSGLPFRRPPATGLLGHYPDRTFTGKPIAAWQDTLHQRPTARFPPPRTRPTRS